MGSPRRAAYALSARREDLLSACAPYRDTSLFWIVSTRCADFRPSRRPHKITLRSAGPPVCDQWSMHHRRPLPCLAHLPGLLPALLALGCAAKVTTPTDAMQRSTCSDSATP